MVLSAALHVIKAPYYGKGASEEIFKRCTRYELDGQLHPMERVILDDLREEHDDELARLSDAGLVEVDQDILKLTTRGALLSNEVFTLLA